MQGQSHLLCGGGGDGGRKRIGDGGGEGEVGGGVCNSTGDIEGGGVGGCGD